MSEPRIAKTRPCVIELEPGSYMWCSCGNSTHQPYCDGKHRGTGFEPVKLVITENTRVAFCQCKHTKNPPFCDQTHKDL